MKKILPILKRFTEIDLFGCEKSTPTCFSEVLEREKLHPEEVVMIGNWPEQALHLPLRVDIKKIIIVQREQDECIIHKRKDIVFVKDLRIVPQILKRRKKWGL